MSEHMPGPWTFHLHRDGSFSITATNPHTHASVICDRGSWPLRAQQSNANARLIAAAPDLLEALQSMVDRWEPDCEGQDRVMWENACAAIAKAQGQS